MDRRSLLKGAAVSIGSSFALSGLAAGAGQAPNRAPQQRVSGDLSKEILLGTTIDIAKLRGVRWDERRAFQYMQRFGEIKGCNYVPSDGSSILHTPNEELIRRELGWAHGVIGLNSVRINLGLAEYQLDQGTLLKNFDNFLKICDENQIKALPILSIQMLDPEFDASAPDAEKPVMNFHPSVHGGGWRYPGRLHWTCCEPEGSLPAKTLDEWPKTKAAAEEFVRAILTRYAKDDRIILWDLYNEAPKAARPLVELIFQWAREMNPSQPLSVCWQGHDLSDVITFHTYTKPGYETPNRNSMGWDFLTELDWARAWGRPMLCTEWLARPFGNTIDAILPFYERYHIGWYVWGLCAVGLAQYQYPWDWPMGSPAPEKWFHCLLYPDGTPYSAEEILQIRDFKYREVVEQVKTQSYWLSWNVDVNKAERRCSLPSSISVTGTKPDEKA